MNFPAHALVITQTMLSCLPARDMAQIIKGSRVAKLNAHLVDMVLTLPRQKCQSAAILAMNKLEKLWIYPNKHT
jgi:hypothetical protein